MVQVQYFFRWNKDSYFLDKIRYILVIVCPDVPILYIHTYVAVAISGKQNFTPAVLWRTSKTRQGPSKPGLCIQKYMKPKLLNLLPSLRKYSRKNLHPLICKLLYYWVSYFLKTAPKLQWQRLAFSVFKRVFTSKGQLIWKSTKKPTKFL